jgi:transcriptional regulator with XRE-family HTH domain
LTFNSTFATLFEKNHFQETYLKSFGNTLRNIRRKRSVSQRDLAQKVGVDFSYISKLENDRTPPPSADTIVKISEVLSVEPAVLLSLSGKLPSNVKAMLGGSLAALEFLAEAKSLSLREEDWKSLTKRLKNLRS